MFSKEVTTGKNMGFKMFPTSSGLFPTNYDGVLRAAIGVLTRSNFPGKNEPKQKQSSAQKTRLVHTKMYMASASGISTLQVIRSDKGIQFMASAPTESEWFTRFITCICSSIGECRNQDAAISVVLMIEIQRLLELEWQLAVQQNYKERIITVAENGLFQILLIVRV